MNHHSALALKLPLIELGGVWWGRPSHAPSALCTKGCRHFFGLELCL